MKRLLITSLFILVAVPSFAATAINLDVDANSAVDVVYGGTNATTAAGALTNLGAASGLASRIVANFDGGGTTAIVQDSKCIITVPFACTITGGQILASKKLGTSGTVSIVVNIWREAIATNFDGGSSHPAVGDKITASAPPTITAANRAAIDPATWGAGATLAKGDILVFNVDSVTDAVICNVVLYVNKL
jgi:hypothetical protein